MAKKEEDVSFVRLDNANMLALTMTQMSKLYTKHAKLILEIKKLRDTKKAKTKELSKKMKNLESKLNSFANLLPKETPETKVKQPVYPTEKPKDVEVIGETSFANLKREFEKIRSELEKIK